MKKVDVEKSGKGAKESFYSVKIKDEATNNEFYMDITGKRRISNLGYE